MIIESIIISLIVGKLRKGKVSNLKEAEIHKWYLLVAAFLVESTAVFMTARGFGFFRDNILYIHLTSYILLFIGMYFNIDRFSFKLIMIGTILNFIVIMLNGGQMPVSQEALLRAGLIEDLNNMQNSQVATHALATKDTILTFLSDVLYLPKSYPRPKVFSIGDILMYAGVFAYLQEVMVKKSGKNIVKGL
ncbi:MAG: hypothetical protein K0R84_1037 [Clostridia bacterium]|jgi:hypothetical protein|nr:hypothetical protein [Clostridia bacterium]